MQDLFPVFVVAPSLAHPRACGIAEPIHPDIRNRKEAENPVVEDDVGVVDLEERGGGELGVFVKPAVAHAATRAYAEGLGFSAVGVVQDVLAPVHLLEARGLSIQQPGDLAEGGGLCAQAAGSDDPEGGVLRRLLGEFPVAVGEVDGGIGRGGFVEMLEKGSEVGAAASGELGDPFALGINRPRTMQLGVAGVELDIHLGVGAEDSTEFVEKAAECLVVDRSAGVDTERDAHGLPIHGVEVEFVTDEAVGGSRCPSPRRGFFRSGKAWLHGCRER